MFDDQPTGVVPAQGQLPDNLPFVEPEDVFQNTDSVPEVDPPSALEVGVLKPKEEVVPEMPTPVLPPTPTYKTHTMPPDQGLQAPTEQPVYTVKDPTLSRGLMTMIIVIIAILIFGGGGWWIYKSFIAPQSAELETNGQDSVGTTPPVVVTPVETTTANDSSSSGDGNTIDDNQILFGQPLDTDGDGLSDDDEVVRGTEPENWDTDGDDLSDGDEVIIWDTDPKNRDTDGDSYADGSEVKAGYSPTGPGRMFEPPTASSPTSTSVLTPTSTRSATGTAF